MHNIAGSKDMGNLMVTNTYLVRQMLSEATAVSKSEPEDATDSVDYLSKFLDIIGNLGKDSRGKPLAQIALKRTIDSTSKALDDYKDLAGEAVPKVIAAGVIKGVDKAIGLALDVPGRAIKRIGDALSGNQKMRIDLMRVVTSAPIVSDAFAISLMKQIDRIKEQVKGKDITPGQAKKLLKTLIATAKAQIIRKESQPGQNVELNLKTG